MDAWEQIKAWRRAKRIELIEWRQAVPRETRAREPRRLGAYFR
jgi:hypothetical protein